MCNSSILTRACYPVCVVRKTKIGSFEELRTRDKSIPYVVIDFLERKPAVESDGQLGEVPYNVQCTSTVYCTQCTPPPPVFSRLDNLSDISMVDPIG
jgi:hypothetical protein